MIKIQVISDAVEERGGTIQRGERKGEEYHIRNQEAYVHNGHAFPERFTISLGQDRPAYAPGMYYIDPACIEVGDYDALRFARSLQLMNEEQAINYLREQLSPAMLDKVAKGPVSPFDAPAKPAETPSKTRAA